MTAFNQPVSGSLSFSGAQQKATAKTLPAASLSFTGSFIKTLGRTFTGSLTFIGNYTKPVGKNMKGVLSFVGNIGVLAVLLRRFRNASTSYLSGINSTKFIP